MCAENKVMNRNVPIKISIIVIENTFRLHFLQQHLLLWEIKCRIQHLQELRPLFFFNDGLFVYLLYKDIQCAAIHTGLYSESACFIVNVHIQVLYTYYFITGRDGKVDDIAQAAGKPM